MSEVRATNAQASNNNVLFTKRTVKRSITNFWFNAKKFITIVKVPKGLPKAQNINRTILFEIREWKQSIRNVIV